MSNLRARKLAVPPEPVAIARACVAAGLSRVSLLHATEPATVGNRHSYVAAEPDAASTAFDPYEGDSLPFDDGELASAPRWIGVIPFEACRGLERKAYSSHDARAPTTLVEPRWLRYPAVIRIDSESGEVFAIGREATALELLARAAESRDPGVSPIELRVADAEPVERHVERVRRAVELILDGDLYQVNLARRLDLELVGGVLDLYAALSGQSPSAFGAALDLDGVHVVSTSPELALFGPVTSALDGVPQIYTEPIKGTRPRGLDADSDLTEARRLDADPKERAELAMIVDVERNDLGRVARPGSVRIAREPHVVTHRTVHHRKALLAAALRSDVTRRELLAAMVPSGSVTGAPKIRAMEVIASLESERRGLYTGVLGHADHRGTFTLAMAIRTAVLEGSGNSYRGEYFAGGGIVAASSPERELEETRWKAAQLERAARAPK